MLRRLLAEEKVDLHDIARFYRALYAALDAKDAERLDELLTAFHKRLVSLVERTYDGRSRELLERRTSQMGATA